MDFLGIGFYELVLILLIALMVFGPRRLPEMAAKAGKFVRELRNISQGFMGEWQREITAAAHIEELEKARQDLEATKKDLEETRREITAQANPAKDIAASFESVKNEKINLEKGVALPRSIARSASSQGAKQEEPSISSPSDSGVDLEKEKKVSSPSPSPPTSSPSSSAQEVVSE